MCIHCECLSLMQLLLQMKTEISTDIRMMTSKDKDRNTMVISFIRMQVLYELNYLRYTLILFYCFQLWSGKWSIKDEHKLLSDLGGSGTTPGQAGYYDSHGGFPAVGAASSAADLYDTINTMSQTGSQNIYTPPLAGALGKYHCSFSSNLQHLNSALARVHLRFKTHDLATIALKIHFTRSISRICLTVMVFIY